jgi:hypothetical protein
MALRDVRTPEAYTAARDRLDLLYDGLTPEGRKALVAAALVLAKEEGLSKGDEQVVIFPQRGDDRRRPGSPTTQTIDRLQRTHLRRRDSAISVSLRRRCVELDVVRDLPHAPRFQEPRLQPTSR